MVTARFSQLPSPPPILISKGYFKSLGKFLLFIKTHTFSHPRHQAFPPFMRHFVFFSAQMQRVGQGGRREVFFGRGWWSVRQIGPKVVVGPV